MRLIRFSFCLGLAACTQFPELADSEGPEVAAAPYPRLLSVEELAMAPAAVTTPELRGSLLARVARLEARAARLRGPVIDRATRARLARGVEAPSLPE